MAWDKLELSLSNKVMNSNNQSSIQISSQSKFLPQIRSYYSLCDHLLQISQQVLRFFPVPAPPYRQTFDRLISIEVKQRQTRQQLSLHLTSAYYSTSEFQRQTYLQSYYVSYLSKLREVPPKIKLLLALQNIQKFVNKGCRHIQKYNSEAFNVGDNAGLNVLGPNEIIKRCLNGIKAIDQLNDQNKNKNSSNQSSTLKDKESFKNFFQIKQFELDKNLVKVILWKYEACILCSRLFLEKQSKKMALNFIKQTKTLLKSGLLNLQTVVRTYIFCLKNAIKKKEWVNKNQEHVYFHIELKKITKSEPKNQLSLKLKEDAESLFKKIQKKLQEQAFQSNDKLGNKNNPMNAITSSNSKLVSLMGHDNSVSFTFKNIENEANLTARLHQNLNKSRSSHTFRPQNQFSSCFNYKFKFNLHRQSQSLNKIKQYQLSLRKQRDQISQNQKDKASSTVRLQTKESAANFKQRKSFNIIKSKTIHNASTKGNHVQQKRESSFLGSNEPKSLKQFERRKQSSKTPSKIYLSIKDKVNKEITISVMGLQNQMFMAPQFVYEKPKITFEEILNDARSMQQRQNDSDSTVFHQTINQIFLQKIQTELQYLFLMNNEYYSFKIKKPAEYTEHFVCTIVTSEYCSRNVKFELSEYFTLKTIRNSIESTDLFFELMQANVKSFKQQPVLKLAMSMRNLSDLQAKDQLVYFTHLNCISNMVQIANYIQPYIYWYFTKRNKINGTILEERSKLQMSDPLKFSINLEFFKKSDYEGCIQLFQTVRNKKGLQQCIMYLSQGRQIVCKRLIKKDRKYFIEVAQIHPKYLKHFQIRESMELSFPVLKIYLRQYQTTEQALNKNQRIVQKAFEKVLRKTLKKRSKKLDDELSIGLERINMSQIFTNDQCNRILINNLNKNYIERRLVQKLIAYLEKRSTNEEVKLKTEQSEIKQFNRIDSTAEGVIFQKEDNCRLEVRLGIQKNSWIQEQINDALKDCLERFLKKDTILQSQNRLQNQKIQLKPESFAQDVIRKGNTLIQSINSKLKNFQTFLTAMIQSYEQCFMLFVRKEQVKKVKLGKRFYQLTVYKFYSNTYFLVVRHNETSKTWVIYLSEKLLRNFDCLTFNVKESQLNKKNEQKSEHNQLLISKKGSIKIKVKPATSLQSKHSFISVNSYQGSLSELSIKSMKSQEIDTDEKVDLFLFPMILNSQSEKFQLCFIKSAFYDSLAIKRKNTNLYLTNLSVKSNSFSVAYNAKINILKKILKPKGDQQKQTHYFYLACSYDPILIFWRVDLYDPKTQSKYVSLIDNKVISQKFPNLRLSSMTSRELEKCTQFWKKLFDQQIIKVNFKDKQLILDSIKFKLFETFGQLSLPSLKFMEQSYIEKVKDKNKSIYELAIKKILNNPTKDKLNTSSTKNSGLAQLLQHKQQVTLILVNYAKGKIYSSEIDQNPTHIFANIFSEHSFKESKNFMYQSLFRRLFQKIESNSILLNQTKIQSLNFYDEGGSKS